MKKGLNFGLLGMEKEDNYGFAFNCAISSERKRTKMPKEDSSDILRGRKFNKRRKKIYN